MTDPCGYSELLTGQISVRLQHAEPLLYVQSCYKPLGSSRQTKVAFCAEFPGSARLRLGAATIQALFSRVV